MDSPSGARQTCAAGLAGRQGMPVRLTTRAGIQLFWKNKRFSGRFKVFIISNY